MPAPIADLDSRVRLPAAEAAVRDLDGLARSTARVKPLVRSLLGVESLSSDQIIALAAGRPVPTDAGMERRMVRFERACQDGWRAGHLDLGVLTRVHRRILPGGGAYRTTTARVGGSTSSTDPIFVAPPASELDRLVADLVVFLARDDLCPVVQAVVGYAQLEAVHPFPDGNGRVGRWLVQVVPRRRGVASAVVPPVGLSFATDSAPFLAAHRAFRDGDVGAWCAYAGTTLEASAASAAALIRSWANDSVAG